MDTQPKRRELDAGAVGGNNAFWKEVAVENSKDRDEYDRLVSQDGRFDAIDPGHIVLHDSEKLKHMWKEISAKYASAHARATQSASHESDFYDFCNSQIEALYVSV
ncbi:hypothetical protein PF002_g11465 [Phytophthora fragariae]|uniref:Uncharacterized protein n=1 Tax=Phytophthora fragariae TaxID=53985 RepID=A0A6A3ZIF8_9STRA|nr:hypothetical protein PF002_g11465 [Phytophthora fragariae]